MRLVRQLANGPVQWAVGRYGWRRWFRIGWIKWASDLDWRVWYDRRHQQWWRP